jgi:hypothetical protein
MPGSEYDINDMIASARGETQHPITKAELQDCAK